MEKSQKLKVDKNSIGQRLDKFLTEKIGMSRSQIKNKIESGLVLVNNSKPTVHYFLKDGDKIVIASSDRNRNVAILSNNQEIASSLSTPRNDNFFNQTKIIADESDFLIIEKPTGVLVHPTEKNETDTIADWLVKKYPEIKSAGEDPRRPGIVHRLDKEVSGLMLIAKNHGAFEYFKSLFKKRELTKRYTALVYGEIERDSDTINYPIGRSKTKLGMYAAHPIRFSEPAKSNGASPDDSNTKLYDKDKEAITKFKVVKKYKKYTLLEVQIFTGRTHQIRVHLCAIGHPVVGDKLYQIKSIKKIPINRIFLHADYLSFKDRAGVNQEFKSRLPLSLKQTLKTLRETSSDFN